MKILRVIIKDEVSGRELANKLIEVLDKCEDLGITDNQTLIDRHANQFDIVTIGS